MRINLDVPDGRSLQKVQHFAPESHSAAAEHADVRIAGNRFAGDLAPRWPKRSGVRLIW